MKLDHNQTPLFRRLVEYSESHVLPFDVPGHKMDQTHNEFTAYVGEATMRLDVNSSKPLDLLSNPTGVIKEAQALLADAYGSEYAYMVINGTSGAVHAMILASLHPGEKILMQRNVHKSAISGVILSGAIPVFIEPEIDPVFGIAHCMTVEDIQEAIDADPDIRAIFLTNPTYFGAVPYLKEIIDFAHSKDVIVLVDEAHGAHFPFSNGLPESGIAYGADFAAVSMHKTGTSLSQSSILLYNSGLVEKHRINGVLNLFQSTSASYLLMSSLDVARKQMVLEGEQKFSHLIHVLYEAKKTLKAAGLDVIDDTLTHHQSVSKVDPMKLVVRVNHLGMTGFEMYDLLKKKHNIQIELAEAHVVMAVIGIDDTEQTIGRLVKAIIDIAESTKRTEKIQISSISLSNPELVIRPQEAFYAKSRRVDIRHANGAISSEAIMIYPPGIPLCIPGERITEGMIERYLFYLNENGIMVNDEENPYVIHVVEGV